MFYPELSILLICSFYRKVTTLGRCKYQSNLLIGSADDTNIISRRHARVVRNENKDHRLFDDSKNGIYVNDIKIEGWLWKYILAIVSVTFCTLH